MTDLAAHDAIHIRRASCADLDTMVNLLGLLFEQEADFAVDPVRQRAGLELLLGDQVRGQLFVAIGDGRVIGMLSALTTVSTAEGGLAGWIEDVVVEPAYRGRGIGSRLLDHAVGWARSVGIRRLSLLTDADNARALALYEQHGFARSRMVALRRQLVMLDCQ
jgi:GNAT superfamily N-acetyltransferase